jgi:CubicO group peptidase (beta-lactamase class C family)
VQTVPPHRQITIRDLLTHTSGIVTDVGTISNREAAKIPRQPTDTLANYLPRLATVPLEFQPGTRWSYSPAIGFDLLARVVEVVSRQSFDQFIRDRILVPLGMNDTAYVLNDPQQRRVATRYTSSPTGLQIQPSPNTTTYFGGGSGLKSTAEDYFRFAQMLLNKGGLDGKRLLSTRAVETMSDVHIPDTLPGRTPGQGWGLSVRVLTNTAVSRNPLLPNGVFGWSGAASTHFWVDPERQIVAIFMNQTPAANILPDFETAVMQAFVEN